MTNNRHHEYSICNVMYIVLERFSSDTSNLKRNQIASIVWFINGKPKEDKYKRSIFQLRCVVCIVSFNSSFQIRWRKKMHKTDKYGIINTTNLICFVCTGNIRHFYFDGIFITRLIKFSLICTQLWTIASFFFCLVSLRVEVV